MVQPLPVLVVLARPRLDISQERVAAPVIAKSRSAARLSKTALSGHFPEGTRRTCTRLS